MQSGTDELEKLQQIELEIFKEFLSVCEKLNLKYYLIAGTLRCSSAKRVYSLG